MSTTLLSENEEEVLGAVRKLRNKKDEPVRTAEVREATGKGKSHTSDLLSQLVEEGELVKIKRGVYELPENTEQSQNDVEDVTDELLGNPHLIPEVEVDAGAGREPQLEEVNGGFYVSEDYIRRVYGVRPEKLCVMRVVGDSMVDTLMPGQRVVAARWEGERPRDGAIYGLHGPTGFMVKRLRFDRKEGRDVIWIWSDNDERGRWWVSMEEFEEEYTPLAWALEVGKKL